MSTKTTSLRNPPSVAIPTLSVGGGGSPTHAADAHPVGSVVVEGDRVEAGRDVGSGVARPGDLVEQLGGDGLAVTAPPVPACLVITLDPSAWTSAIGKPA